MSDSNSSGIARTLKEIKREGEERAAARTAGENGLPYIDLRKAPIAIEAVKLVPKEAAEEGGLMPLQVRLKDLAVAVVDPKNPRAQENIEALRHKGYTVKVFVGSLAGISQAWHYYQFVIEEGKEITGKVEFEQTHLEELLTRLTTIGATRDEIGKIDFQKLAVSELLEVAIAGALKNRASDIHIEAEEESAKVRFRVDGILQDVFAAVPIRNYQSLVSRIKLLSGLKINVRDEPQDGRFTVELTRKEIEMRVSIIPSEFGETVVMRILDPDAIALTLQDLGLRADDRAIVERELKKPNGLVLNTGPTGSGKTTTLYAFLRRVSNPEVKIITIEDPIEYHLAGVEQTQVDPDAHYTFASGLRSILRQDPDVILVGEIRDKETADIAMQAALTGHLVFSTLHTNDAVGAIPRLGDLGVKPSTIGPALSLVIAQRLVRKLCGKCKTEKLSNADIFKKIRAFLARLPKRVDRNDYETPTLYAPGGCSDCNGMGYKGRIGIFEFLEIGPEIQDAIFKEVSGQVLLERAKTRGIVLMQEDGILKTLSGVTTFEEVEKATGPIEW